VHPEIEELQTKLKEILYDCAVEIRATKAALYLYDRRDNRFELVTEYGFRGVGIRAATNRNDVIVDRCGRRHSAFFVNGLVAEPLFAEMLYEASTDRMLVAPIYLRGMMVGFIDMRDKPGKQPFDNADLQSAAMIAERIKEIFAERDVFGHRFISVSLPVGEREFGPSTGSLPVNTDSKSDLAAVAIERGGAAVSTAPLEAPALAAPSPKQVNTTTRVVPRPQQLIGQAQTATKVLRSAPNDEITETELAIARQVLPLILQIPGVVAAALSALAGSGHQEVASHGTMNDESMRILVTALNESLAKYEEKASFLKRNVAAHGDKPLAASDVQKVFSMPIQVGSLKRVYLSVVFRHDPALAAHDLMVTMHRQLESAIELSLDRRNRDATRRRIAERLLEPDFVKYPELRRHTEAVVKRVDAFARFLALSSAEIETARVFAIVHDVGMRLLDYERLYRKRDLSPDEFELLKAHPTIGAAIVEPHLGIEIARLVYMHHERWGGGGYPVGNVVSEEIPLLSRVLQICDAYESMVAMDTYHLPLTFEQAMEAIRVGAGTEYDPNLAVRFIEMMRGEKK
jgi:HD-GYP domain-containing protein (c-di-GMP phosphodiesterase class II)